MTLMRLRQALFRSPIALIRAMLDVTLIGSWIWLASESLPQPIPALGAAIFGAASAGYWAMHNAVQGTPLMEQDVPPRAEELGRLTRFTNRPAREPVLSSEEWFNDPEIGRRIQAEADRSKELGIPLAVIFVRAQPSSLAEWSDGMPPRNLAEVLPHLLDGSRQKHLSGANGREAVIAFCGGERTAAVELLQELRHQLEPAECEAGFVIYPEEGVDPAALISLARLRLQPMNGLSRSALSTIHYQDEEGDPTQRSSDPQQEADRPGAAVS